MKSARIGSVMAGLLSAILVTVGGLFIGPLSSTYANEVTELSDVAQAAFEDLTTCLTSGRDKAIDVFYLIDESDSMLYTDPAIVREEILSGSVLQLANFADQGIAVNVGAALFSTGINPVFGWRPVASPADAEAVARDLSGAIIASATRGSAVKWTDYEAGLRHASERFAEINDGSHCQALIWLTDGGIRPELDKSLILPSLARLCHSDISEQSLQRQSYSRLGLMNDLRLRGVSVFAVLYKNEDALRAERQAQGLSPAEIADVIEEFRYTSSFLKPLVEGSGLVYQGSRIPGFPAGEYLECADLAADGKALAGQPNGAFLDAADPITLAYQFLKLQAQIDGGTNKQIGEGGFFSIEPGTAAFRILTTATDWTLFDSEQKVRASPGTPPPVVVTSERTGVTTILLTADAETDLGQWEFRVEDEIAISSLYVYAGLTLSLDRDRETPIVAGRDNTLGGVVVRQTQYRELPFDLSVYRENRLSLEIVQDGILVPVTDVQIVQPDPVSGSFRIEGFNPGVVAGEQLDVQLTLFLGGDFQPIKSRFSLNVLSSGSFPVLASSVVTLSPLEGPEGAAEGELVVIPPSEVDGGEFCIAREAKRVSDPQAAAVAPVDRAEEWEWVFTAGGMVRDSGSLACFEVPRSDDPFVISVRAQNRLQADSSVESVHEASSGGLGQAPAFSEDIVFEFQSVSQQSAAVFLIVFIGLLILGIVIPLLLLYLVNRLTSYFLWPNGLVRAEFPVKVRIGLTASFVDSTTGSPIVVGPQDFRFLADRVKPRAVNDEPHGLPVARVPLFPLNPTWTEWVANVDHRVVSVDPDSVKSGARFADGKVTEISPNMARNWALVFRESDLVDSAGRPDVAAVLVVYSDMGDLGKYQGRLAEIQAIAGLTDRIEAVRQAVLSEGIPGGDSTRNIGDDVDPRFQTTGEGKPHPPPTISGPGLPPPPA